MRGRFLLAAFFVERVRSMFAKQNRVGVQIKTVGSAKEFTSAVLSRKGTGIAMNAGHFLATGLSSLQNAGKNMDKTCLKTSGY